MRKHERTEPGIQVTTHLLSDSAKKGSCSRCTMDAQAALAGRCEGQAGQLAAACGKLQRRLHAAGVCAAGYVTPVACASSCSGMQGSSDPDAETPAVASSTADGSGSSAGQADMAKPGACGAPSAQAPSAAGPQQGTCQEHCNRPAGAAAKSDTQAAAAASSGEDPAVAALAAGQKALGVAQEQLAHLERQVQPWLAH